jgi:hypothetical protein
LPDGPSRLRGNRLVIDLTFRSAVKVQPVSSQGVLEGDFEMRSFLRILLVEILILGFASLAQAQSPDRGNAPLNLPGWQIPGAQRKLGPQEIDNLNTQPANVPGGARQPPEQELTSLQKDLDTLRKQLAATQAAAQQDEKLKKQVELLQKQIETQQKIIQLLVDRVRTQTALQEARSQQAARRDQELSQGIDNVAEHLDAVERNGPRLPAALKELFLGSGTNESPLSIYGVLAFGYTKENGKPGGFEFGELSPQFLLQLNDRFLLEGEITVGPKGAVSLGRAQVDAIVSDWLTVVAGNFESPIGFFNERLNHPWFNKFPDTAVFFRQVSPGDLLLLGVQARGAFYLGCSPVKLEYNAYVTNGLENNVTNPRLTDVANLEGLENTYDVVGNDLACGGRLGIWVPEIGLTAGLSGFHNGGYLPT